MAENYDILFEKNVSQLETLVLWVGGCKWGCAFVRAYSNFLCFSFSENPITGSCQIAILPSQTMIVCFIS